MDISSMSPNLQAAIVERRSFFEKYELFIDFLALEDLIARRGRLTIPELALHIVRVRGQRILDLAKTQAGLEVLVHSSEMVIKKMEEVSDQYDDARTRRPELAVRLERMAQRILDELETIPLKDLKAFRDRFGQY